MDIGKWFNKTFKISMGLFIFAVIISLIYLSTQFIPDGDIIQVLRTITAMIMLVSVVIAAIVLQISMILGTIDVLQSKNIGTIWKILWVISIFAFGLVFIVMVYYYFCGRKKAYPGEYKKQVLKN